MKKKDKNQNDFMTANFLLKSLCQKLVM